MTFISYKVLVLDSFILF